MTVFVLSFVRFSPFVRSSWQLRLLPQFTRHSLVVFRPRSYWYDKTLFCSKRHVRFISRGIALICCNLRGRNDIFEDFWRNARAPYLITSSAWRRFLRRIVTRPPASSSHLKAADHKQAVNLPLRQRRRYLRKAELRRQYPVGEKMSVVRGVGGATDR